MAEAFEKNVRYLQRNIPPDDIYIFTEQTFMAAVFFLSKWAEWIDLKEECAKCPVVNKWVGNILGFKRLKESGVDLELDLDMKSLEDDENSPGG